MPSRRRFLKSIGYWSAGIAGTSGFGWYYGTRVEVERIRLERVKIPVKGLRGSLEGFRIAVLSDFHLYPTTTLETIAAAVELAQGLKADLAVLLGDFVQRRADAIDDLAPVLTRLNPKHGVFAILGNHDHWKGADLVEAGLAKVGIPVLRNQGVPLEIGDATLYLAGVDDGWVRRNDLALAMEGVPSNATTILLAHEPDFADQYSGDPRIALQLSGHSHGGQVRIPLYGSPFCPPYGVKYDMGLYRVNDMWLYTNVGIGVTAPIRLNCPPEVTEIVLTAA